MRNRIGNVELECSMVSRLLWGLGPGVFQLRLSTSTKFYTHVQFIRCYLRINQIEGRSCCSSSIVSSHLNSSVISWVLQKKQRLQLLRRAFTSDRINHVSSPDRQARETGLSRNCFVVKKAFPNITWHLLLAAMWQESLFGLSSLPPRIDPLR